MSKMGNGAEDSGANGHGTNGLGANGLGANGLGGAQQSGSEVGGSHGSGARATVVLDDVRAATLTAPLVRPPAPGPAGGPDDDVQDVTPLAALGAMTLRALSQAGSIVLFGGTVVKSAVRHPRGYWSGAGVEFYVNLRLVAIPMVISLVGFGLGAPGIQGGNIENIFGIPEQLGSFFVMASIREFAPWIDAMVVAGVVGTAITADLGARRIREELDALEVLGLDPIRELVIPRVVATMLLTGLCDVAGVLIGAIGGYIAAVPLLGAAPGNFFHDFFANASATDLWGSVVKTTIFGLVIGVVCCYKGLRAEGGPAGVGRAVNQAVVASFALIWVINYVFTDILLGTHPGIQVIK